MTEEERADLREQLCALRAALVGRLVQRIDGGDIALLGSVGAALQRALGGHQHDTSLSPKLPAQTVQITMWQAVLGGQSGSADEVIQS
jgi:hypothetical protein